MARKSRSELLLERALKTTEQPKRTQFVNKLFIQQRAFFDDPAKFKAAVCSRRAGKSHTAACMLLEAVRANPSGIALYIALTYDSAKQIMWTTLHEICRAHSIPFEAKETGMIFKVFGGTIRLIGADMKQMKERLRGVKYSIVVLDEAGSFGRHIAELVDDVLTPALVDLDGSLVLIGTPSVLPQGFFYEATTGTEFSTHRWTLRDNPYLLQGSGQRFKTVDEYLADLLKKRGWTLNNPTYRREYLGEWVEDTDKLVYKFNPHRNSYTELPSGIEWNYTIGLDYGWNDATAWSVVAFSPASRDAFVVHNEAASELTPSAIANRTRELVERYSPIAVVCDVGGLGKSLTEELRQRYSLPVEAAEKKEKYTFIDLLNGDFVDQHLWIHDSLKELRDQYRSLAKDERGKEHPGMANDRLDATLYAYRKALHYVGRVPEGEVKPGTREWDKKAEEEFRKRVEDSFNTELQVPWWVQ